jgi:hypothetical protein
MKAADQKQEHTSSYYAASVNEVTDYPMVEGKKSADVCVVGAGFTGVATALTLAERGYSVALVEANRVGWGASGRNGGQVINGISGLDRIRKKHGGGIAGMLWDLKWRGNDIIHDRVEKYGIRCDLKNGFVTVAAKPRQAAWYEEYAREREQHDFPYEYEIWDRDKTCAMLGTDAYHGGFICYRDGHLHPLNLCIGEARAAHALGAQIFEQSPVIASSSQSTCPTSCFLPAVTLLVPSLCPQRWPTRSTRWTSQSVIPTRSWTTTDCPPTSACSTVAPAIIRAVTLSASSRTFNLAC